MKYYPKLPGLSPNVIIKFKLEFLNEHNIDYVCHDDIPYVTAGV